MSRRRGSGERGAPSTALSLRERAMLHRRAAEVLAMIANIEETLRCFNADWFARVSAEDQQGALEDLRRVEDGGFILEAELALSPMPGGAR